MIYFYSLSYEKDTYYYTFELKSMILIIFLSFLFEKKL